MYVFPKKSTKKTKCRGNLAMKRVRIQISYEQIDERLDDKLRTQLTPGIPYPTIYKWLEINWMMNQIFLLEMVGNHQTSIYKWLFGVQGRYMSSQYVHVWFVCLQLRDKIKDIPSGIQSMAAKVTSKVHPWFWLQGYTLED